MATYAHIMPAAEAEFTGRKVDPSAAASEARREAAACRDEAHRLAHRLALRSQAQRDKAALLDRIAYQLEAAAVPAPIAELKSIVAGMSSRNAEMIRTISELHS